MSRTGYSPNLYRSKILRPQVTSRSLDQVVLDGAPVALDGSGFLAGSFPGGATTVDGAPVSATVRVIYRPKSGEAGDSYLVKEISSAPDGTWVVQGLNPELKFDVVGRLAGFNDVIVADVRPKVEV